MNPIKTLWALVLALCTACSVLAKPPAVALAGPPVPTAADLDSMAVALVDEDGRIFCSGTWVGRGKVLTAAHCVKDATAFYWVRSNPGETSMAAVRLKVDPTKDLGLLLVPGDATIHGEGSVGPGPQVGDTILGMNNTMGLENSYMRGYVGAYRTDPEGDNQVFMEVMIPGSYGASGSAAFDIQGRIVGVASWKVRGWDGVLFYVDADDVRTFLAK